MWNRFYISERCSQPTSLIFVVASHRLGPAILERSLVFSHRNGAGKVHFRGYSRGRSLSRLSWVRAPVVGLEQGSNGEGGHGVWAEHTRRNPRMSVYVPLISPDSDLDDKQETGP